MLYKNLPLLFLNHHFYLAVVRPLRDNIVAGQKCSGRHVTCYGQDKIPNQMLKYSSPFPLKYSPSFPLAIE